MTIEQIPDAIYEAVRNRGYDDDAIVSMDARQLFTEYCEWHGLIRWGGNLFSYATQLARIEAIGSKENGK